MKDTTKLTSLERNIYGRNLINKLARKNVEKALPQIKEFLGQKIRLQNGDKSAKFNIDLYKRPGGKYFRTYLTFDVGGYCGRTLWLNQDVTVKDSNIAGGGHTVTYYKETIHVGTVDDNGMLTEVPEIQDLIDSYKLDKVFKASVIKRKAARLEKLKSEVRQLESEVNQFTKVH